MPWQGFWGWASSVPAHSFTYSKMKQKCFFLWKAFKVFHFFLKVFVIFLALFFFSPPVCQNGKVEKKMDWNHKDTEKKKKKRSQKLQDNNLLHISNTNNAETFILRDHDLLIHCSTKHLCLPLALSSWKQMWESCLFHCHYKFSKYKLFPKGSHVSSFHTSSDFTATQILLLLSPCWFFFFPRLQMFHLARI